MEIGDPMFVWCEGGPSLARTVTFPPPAEIETAEGVDVLADEGPPETWFYEFVG